MNMKRSICSTGGSAPHEEDTMNPDIDNTAMPAGGAQDNTALFRRLRELKRACGSNKHDQATMLIEALLDERIDTRARIVGALRRLGFSNDHAVLVLSDGIAARRWRRDADGRYSRPAGVTPASPQS